MNGRPGESGGLMEPRLVTAWEREPFAAAGWRRLLGRAPGGRELLAHVAPMPADQAPGRFYAVVKAPTGERFTRIDLDSEAAAMVWVDLRAAGLWCSWKAWTVEPWASVPVAVPARWLAGLTLRTSGLVPPWLLARAYPVEPVVAALRRAALAPVEARITLTINGVEYDGFTSVTYTGEPSSLRSKAFLTVRGLSRPSGPLSVLRQDFPKLDHDNPGAP